MLSGVGLGGLGLTTLLSNLGLGDLTLTSLLGDLGLGTLSLDTFISDLGLDRMDITTITTSPFDGLLSALFGYLPDQIAQVLAEAGP